MIACRSPESMIDPSGAEQPGVIERTVAPARRNTSTI
jgi:hypothetical protein